MRYLIFLMLIMVGKELLGQKKPLDHSVYDQWESIGDRKISDDGKWIAFSKNVQEGDDQLFISATDGSRQFNIPRGYQLTFNLACSHAVMLIKPPYSATRKAKINKKKPEDMPKDSLAVVNLTTGEIKKVENVKSFAFPSHAASPVAIHLHRSPQDSTSKPSSDKEEGTPMLVDYLDGSTPKRISAVSAYEWSRNGKLLVMSARQQPGLTGSVNGVVIYRALERRLDTISRGGKLFTNFAIDTLAYQVAFTAERDTSSGNSPKYHSLWYWTNGSDSALMIADRNAPGMRIGWSVSENRDLQFSDNGERLFFGTAPLKPIRDTSVPEIDRVKLDIWHYNDSRLQSQQLAERNADLKRSYLAVFDFKSNQIIQLGDLAMKTIMMPASGEGNLFVGVTDTSRRKESQWTGEVNLDIYAVDPRNGAKVLVKWSVTDMPQLSPGGEYISWYDAQLKHFFTWRSGKTINVSRSIPFPLFDEEHDTPNDPSPYARPRWLKYDAGILLKDRYDIWNIDPAGERKPILVTGGKGRKDKISFSFVMASQDDKDPNDTSWIYLSGQQESSKEASLFLGKANGKVVLQHIMSGPYLINQITKSKYADVIAYSKETFQSPPQLFIRQGTQPERLLLRTNAQQDKYSWGTAELFYWKAYDGKQATGMVFKPDGFQAGNKYPMICYFYERDSESLFRYRPPAPTPSRLDISFFVSRGYIVFVPDIHYKTGYPGKSAYDYVVSGARAIVKKGWADSTRIGLQGQSWGGYQICYLITRTKLFAAAWAGAPVANMTSAYGGIRWGTGLNRQFQYEKTQSRIGATLWEKQGLYLENSPLFYVPVITTPLVMMSNDDDDAVPWYQGIEMFTAMRRLDKPVWLLNYNGEKHNLVERKNRKDLSIREQQFFDWLLKGEKPPRWITDGIPATEKDQ